MSDFTKAQAGILSMTSSPEIKDKLQAAFERINKKTAEQMKAEEEADRLKANQYQLKSFRDQAFNGCGLTGDQWEHSFKTYNPKHYSQRVALQKAQEFVKAFPETNKGLMLYGQPGRGKDHLLHAVTMALLDREDAVWHPFFIYSLDIESKMFEEWRHHKDEETRLEQTMRECDLLLIGDIHLIFKVKSDAIRRAFDRVINQAEATGSPIICATSNASLKDFDSQEEVSSRMCSRLAKIFDWVEVQGEDARRTI
jgi:DNA replication protein DnaC